MVFKGESEIWETHAIPASNAAAPHPALMPILSLFVRAVCLMLVDILCSLQVEAGGYSAPRSPGSAGLAVGAVGPLVANDWLESVTVAVGIP